MRLFSITQVRERLGGISTGRVYELLGAAKLEAVKLAGRTLVTEASLERLIASLPRAVITTQPRRRKKIGRERL